MTSAFLPPTLRARHHRVLDAYIRLGGYKDVATELDLSYSTVKGYMQEAREILSVTNITQACVLYDRMERNRAA